MSDMVKMISSMSGLARRPDDAPKSADEAGEQFELMMANLLLKEVRKSMPKDGMFSSSEMSMFNEMLDQELAQRMVEGPGLGLKEQIADAIRSARSHLAPSPGGEGMPVDGVRTSGFGLRRDPITGRNTHHPGLDIAAPRGTPIRAARDGVVRWAGEVEGYGRVVYLDHGDGVETRYAHCERLDVREGESVQAGEVIESVGSSGRSTGPHLHYELRVDGRAVDPESDFFKNNEGPP